VNPLISRSRIAVAACLALVLALGPTAAALATTLSDKRAQATAVQAKVDALIAKQEIASEDYNAARERYQSVSAQVAATGRRISRLQASTRSLQAALGNQADAMYREGGSLGLLEALLSSQTLDDFNSTMELIQRIGEQNATTVSQLKVTEQQTAAEQRRLVVAQAEAGVQQSAMAKNSAAVNARLADQRRLLAGISSDIKAILARQAAAAAAAAAARAGRVRIDMGGNPPTSSKGAAAVWWAEKALGCRYVWAASGPTTFDCSGLTMWAYRHVGISLPHFSRAQINVGSRVSRNNLEPGDLVFFGSPIHHVGMYVGGGEFIEAPYTGARVRISTLGNRSDYVGACRP
jgi:cell wall-associated NlpC family hydrolase